MIEIAAALQPTPADEAEARRILEWLAASNPSVLDELAADIVDAAAGQPVRVTASGAAGRAALEYWVAGLNDTLGVSADPARPRIHLHGTGAASSGYSAGSSADAADSALIAEVVAQGESAAAKYVSLVAAADAVTALLRDDQRRSAERQQDQDDDDQRTS